MINFGYGIGLDARWSFSLSDGSVFGKNWIIFFVTDMISLVHIDSKKKGILALSKGPADGLDYITLTVEKKNPINFTEHRKKFCWSLHYNEVISYIFTNGVEIYILKAIHSEINAAPLCLGNPSKDFSLGNWRRLDFWICLWFFSWLW